MERDYTLIGIHSQSNRPDTPFQFEGDDTEQAYDSRILCLSPDIAVVSFPIEVAYANYFNSVLKQKLPSIIAPKNSGLSLSKSVMQDAAITDFLFTHAQHNEGLYVLSVFDPTDTEKELLMHLQGKQIDILPEVNFQLAAALGNKAGFRKFCGENNLPQLPGGVFTSLNTLNHFVTTVTAQDAAVIIKHPHGTAGQGISVVHRNTLLTPNDYERWQSWISHGGEVVAEVFSPGGKEHALHVYIDPISKKSRLVGLYDQLVTKKSDGTLSHYGCKYPVEDTAVEKELTALAERQIIPSLTAIGYTGPACFDILSDPIHCMELNTRAGANMYAHRIVESVARKLYGTEQVAFMFLSGLEHDIKSFEQFINKYHDILTPKPEGTIIFTNPGRHAFGSYDIIAMSPNGIESAETVLFSSLEQIWGEVAAKEFFDRIYARSI